MKCNKIHFLIPLRVIIDIWFHLYLNTNTFDLKIWAFIRVHILYGRWIQFEMEVQDFLPIYLWCIKFWGGFCSKSSSKSLLTNTYTSFSMKQVKGKKNHWNNKSKTVQTWLHRRIFFWLYINYCGTSMSFWRKIIVWSVPTLLVRSHVADLQWSKREGKRQMIGYPPPHGFWFFMEKKLKKT